MNSNRLYVRKAMYILVIVAFLFDIYALFKAPSLAGSALLEDDEKEDHERLAKLDPPSSSASGTVLDVTGQLGAVQGEDCPCTILATNFAAFYLFWVIP